MPEDPFTAGHLGELTRVVSTDLVDAAIDAAGAAQKRLRRLPTRVVVYVLLAGVLFADVGYRQVLTRLTTGAGAAMRVPGSSALSQAFRRIGVRPLAELFDLVRGPAAGSPRWRGLRVCAIDGTSMFVPDTTANAVAFGRQTGRPGAPGGYPMLRLLTIVACGSRTIIDAAFGSYRIGETSYAPHLLDSLAPGMVLLADRNFASAALITQIADTGAQLLIRCKNGRRFTVVESLGDGTTIALIGATRVRVIDAVIRVELAPGSGRYRTGTYRLITTLTDAERYPALAVVELYHQRWEIETSFRETKATLLDGRVLRAHTPAGIAQEVYAVLIVAQSLRTAIADTALASAGTEPTQLSFTIALNTARDGICCAAIVLTEPVTDLIGRIGTALLANVLPHRRSRSSPRIVKRAISKHRAKGSVDRTNYTTTITTRIHTTSSLTPGHTG
ncbi:IS4 family transposase [Flexivirga oryzae]|uniref:IS4 family transposase n=1 Tax=Flexivirga oryzae TaxID=1794944 RepID=UPI00161B4CBF